MKFLWSLFLLITPCICLSETVSGKHGGHIYQNNGIQYELVTNSKERRVQVYPVNPGDAKLPSTIVVKVKKQDSIVDHIRLALDTGSEFGTSHAAYVGKIPANIYVSGGVTFELEF